MKHMTSISNRLLAFLLALLLFASPCLAAAQEEDPFAENPYMTDSVEEPAEDASVQEEAAAQDVSNFVPSAAVSFSSEAKAAMLIDLNTGRSIYEKNADERIYPASLTKIMTCLLALENGNLSDVITVSESAYNALDADSSTAGLLVGEQLTLEQLLYCMMVVSGNETCNVIAEYIAGSVDEFVRMMNERAYELGCIDTHFNNPHGLHDENHYTTARDLSIITQAALKSTNFKEIVSTAEYELPATNLSEERTLKTTNQLIQKSSSNPYYYSKAHGIKTGYTSAAGRCVISWASSDDLELLAIICGANTSIDDDGNLIMESFPECIRLFDYGFENYGYVNVLSPLYPVCQVEVLNAAGAETVALAPAQEIRVLMPLDYNKDLLTTDITSQSAEAPVQEGDVLGKIVVKYRDTILGQSDLCAISSVERSQTLAVNPVTGAYVQQNWWKWVVVFFVLLFVLLIVLIVWMQIRKKKRRRLRMERRRKALLEQQMWQNRQDFWDNK